MFIRLAVIAGLAGLSLSAPEPTRYKVDQRVPVVYVPGAPSRAEIDQPRLHETSVTPFRTVGGIWIGAMTLVCGGLWLVLGRRAGRRPGPHSGPLGPS